MKTAASATALLLLVTAFSAPAFASESTRKDFDDFCQAWQGRWVSDTTLVVDRPGIGQKGDKFTAYADCRVEHEGNAMICTYYGGKGSATWLVVYDAGDRRIKSLWITSGGDVAHATIYKEGDQWVQASSGSQADGTKTEVTLTITITDNGETHTWRATPADSGQEAADEGDVWHRVGK
jgi:hypothetical protein